ncbi:MAG: hypothetical protein WC763_01485 [Candidatus Paceibacterota bacterium]|jgi:hypothetical protein
MSTHHHKRWHQDRPVRIALVSGFFSTFITLLNALANALMRR